MVLGFIYMELYIDISRLLTGNCTLGERGSFYYHKYFLLLFLED